MKFSRKIVLFGFLAIGVICRPGLINAQHLENKVDSLITEKTPPEGPGTVVLVARGNEILYHKAFGMANLELGVPMQPGQVFQIGSMTKQFTAIAILKLMEAGKLRLEDDIRRFIPDYPCPMGPVTIHQLLNHTSGIKDFTSMKTIMEIAQKDLEPKELIDFFKGEPVDFAPGTQFKYNNSGYVLLGYIVEKASGLSYEEYIESEVFAPAGMSDSRYTHYREIVPNRAYGYHNREGYTNKMHISMNIPYASGALMSTADDLLKWQRALLSEKLVSRSILELALSPKKLADGSPVEYGYGWHIKTLEGTRSVEHGGSVFGFKSMGVYLPEKDIYVVGLTNCDCISPTQLVRDIASLAFQSHGPSGTFPEDTYSIGSQGHERISDSIYGPNERLISAYYAQNLKIFQAHSTKADIDALFEIFTKDFTYTHMGYGGLYSREELYQGYLRNQQNGEYNGEVADFQITETMLGVSAIAVKRRFITLEAGTRVAGDAQMTLFEFRGGKISRIVEYW